MKAPVILLLLSASCLFGLINEIIGESTDLADSVVIFELEFIDGKKTENIIYSSNRPEEVSSMLFLQKKEPKVTVEKKVDEDGNVIGKTTTFNAMSVRCMCVGNPLIKFQKEGKVVLSVSVHHWKSIRETEGYKDNHDLTAEASKRLKDFVDSLKQTKQIKAELSTPLAPASLTP